MSCLHERPLRELGHHLAYDWFLVSIYSFPYKVGQCMYWVSSGAPPVKTRGHVSSAPGSRVGGCGGSGKRRSFGDAHLRFLFVF